MDRTGPPTHSTSRGSKSGDDTGHPGGVCFGGRPSTENFVYGPRPLSRGESVVLPRGIGTERELKPIFLVTP